MCEGIKKPQAFARGCVVLVLVHCDYCGCVCAVAHGDVCDCGVCWTVVCHGYGVVDQRYYGDVNIVGKYGLRHYSYMLQNPRPHLFKLLQREGERATWPKISMIETHARVGKTIQHCLEVLTALDTAEMNESEFLAV